MFELICYCSLLQVRFLVGKRGSVRVGICISCTCLKLIDLDSSVFCRGCNEEMMNQGAKAADAAPTFMPNLQEVNCQSVMH